MKIKVFLICPIPLCNTSYVDKVHYQRIFHDFDVSNTSDYCVEHKNGTFLRPELLSKVKK